ncbi:hypothetical protein SESBI_21488 [Sesbania bispinosa]|nr:hypothetical protein SESBI_21488 [Sesbania bispinosa]
MGLFVSGPDWEGVWQCSFAQVQIYWPISLSKSFLHLKCIQSLSKMVYNTHARRAYQKRESSEKMQMATRRTNQKHAESQTGDRDRACGWL